MISIRTAIVASRSTSFGYRGVVQTLIPERSKKRTQTNPLRLSVFESERYSSFDKNEPIDVKTHVYNHLQLKNGLFLKNMDEMPTEVGHYSRIEPKRTH